MSTETWEPQYRAALRDLISKHGRKVLVEEKRYQYQEDDDVSAYGWTDFDAEYHIIGKYGQGGPCKWVVPEGAQAYERTYSQFAGTFTDNNDEVGINVIGCSCECGQYTDVLLRWTGSLGDAMRIIFGSDPGPKTTFKI